MSDKQPITMGKKYRTLEDDEVQILCTDACGDLPVVGLVLPHRAVMKWDKYGRFHTIAGDVRDLVEVKPKAVFHMILRYDPNTVTYDALCSWLYTSEAMALAKLKELKERYPKSKYWYERIEKEIE